LTEVNEGIQHRAARRIVEFYLQSKDRQVAKWNNFQFPPEFVKKHKLGTRSKPNTSHSYDIMTDTELVEIDDLDYHPKPSRRINDGIAGEYATVYHPEYRFYRLLKEEIADRKGRILDPKDVADYLKEHLF